MESVWQLISKKPLDRSHYSLVDVKAQTDVFIHENALPFVDRANSIRPIELLLSYREASEVKKGLKTNWHVHGPLIEFNQNSVSWEPQRSDSYDGCTSVGWEAPSIPMKDTALQSTSLAGIFLYIYFKLLLLIM